MNNQEKTDWMDYFNERQQRLIDSCRRYAHDNPAGLPGHQLMLIIARMAELLEASEVRLPRDMHDAWIHAPNSPEGEADHIVISFEEGVTNPDLDRLGIWTHHLVPPAAKERLMDAIDGALAEMKDRYGRIKIEEDPPVAAGEGDD